MRSLHAIPRKAFCTGASLRTRVSNGCKVQAFFKFGKNGADSKEAGVYNSISKRDDYDQTEMENYFEYTGRLAVEGNYDCFDKYREMGMHPCEVILLWACEEGDTPKIEELLSVGANIDVKDINGKSPMDLAANDDVREVLQAAMSKAN